MAATHMLSYGNDPNHWKTLKSAVLLTSLLMLSWHNTSFATAGGIFVSKSILKFNPLTRSAVTA